MGHDVQASVAVWPLPTQFSVRFLAVPDLICLGRWAQVMEWAGWHAYLQLQLPLMRLPEAETPALLQVIMDRGRDQARLHASGNQLDAAENCLMGV